jgi:UDP-N-acetylmuramyl pentapeptide phosphotransferase/UDP-N-acetylglucosamine-1-phosphate transferase
MLQLNLSNLAWVIAAVLWIGWCTNLYNFMDGTDGLAGGMAVLGFSAYGFTAASTGDQHFATACYAVAAASAGFLLFNFHPAKVFMGDAGSIPLGFLMGALGLLGRQANLWPFWFPTLVFSPFIADATVTLFKRALRGERFWQAHREHYYQRLVRMGWSHRRVALSEYVLMIAAALSAIAMLRLNCRVQFVGLLLWVSLYAAAMIMIDIRWKRHQAKEGMS